MCGSFPGLLIGRTAVHSGKDPAFVAYDQFLSTGILQRLSQDEVPYGSKGEVSFHSRMSAFAGFRHWRPQTNRSSFNDLCEIRAGGVWPISTREEGPSGCTHKRGHWPIVSISLCCNDLHCLTCASCGLSRQR